MEIKCKFYGNGCIHNLIAFATKIFSSVRILSRTVFNFLNSLFYKLLLYTNADFLFVKFTNDDLIKL